MTAPAPAPTTVKAGPLLADYFGQDLTQIGELVTDFDFSKIKVSKGKANVYLHTDITPCFGDLNHDTLAALDDEVKIALVGTVKTLTKQKAKSYETVVSALMQTPLLEADEASNAARSDKLIRETSSDFEFEKTDSIIVGEAQSWFQTLISDEDVLKDIRFDINVLASVVAKTKVTIDSIQSFFTQKEYHEQPLVDITVLRFPDAAHPYFKLYQIKLVAWVDSTRTLAHQTDKLGLTGEFTSKVFRPRSTVIEGLSESARASALVSASALFDA